jgi:hypothetical protein
VLTQMGGDDGCVHSGYRVAGGVVYPYPLPLESLPGPSQRPWLWANWMAIDNNPLMLT